MFKRYKLLPIFIVVMIIFSSCSSNSDNSDKINVDIDKLKFKEEIGNTISSEFGIYLLTSTNMMIEWYNTYRENSTDEKLSTISLALTELLTEDVLYYRDSSLMNSDEMKIYNKLINTGKEINIRTSEELKIKNEESLREKNLKELSDEEYEMLINRRENHKKTIKGFIEDIIEKYYIN